MSTIIDNLFPAQGKTVIVSGNSISAGLAYARIVANADEKPILVGTSSVKGEWYQKMFDAAIPKLNEGLAKQVMYGTPSISKIGGELSNNTKILDAIIEFSDKLKEKEDTIVIGGENYSKSKLLRSVRGVGMRSSIASQLLLQHSMEQMFDKPDIRYLPATNFEPKELTPMTYFSQFINVRQPDGSNRKLSEKEMKEIRWHEKMCETHTPQLIKKRKGGTQVIWVKKEE